MKLATFTVPGRPTALAGVVDADADAGTVRAFAEGESAVKDVLAGNLSTDADLGRYRLAEVKLLAPIPQPGSIFAIGLNYADHVAEMGDTPPEWPVVFVKVTSSVTGPSGPVRCPQVVDRLDYECELALVIGQEGAVAGYAVANDVSSRDLQQREPHWVRAKGADTFCPYGPWITTVDEIEDPQNLEIKTWVNGELRQSSNTKNLIFGPDYLVGFLSETCTLRPGDLILTGTPGGVAAGMKPPRFLRSGDTVRIEVERLGVIEHHIV